MQKLCITIVKQLITQISIVILKIQKYLVVVKNGRKAKRVCEYFLF